MNIDHQAMREFREVYLVSNTPLYLFKRLRQLQAVQQLAHGAEAEELIEEYIRRVKAKERTMEDVAIAYACLVAMTQKESPEAISLLRSLDLTDLNWASVIRDIYFTKKPAESTGRIKILNPSLPAVYAGTDAAASSAFTEPPKPKIEEEVNI